MSQPVHAQDCGNLDFDPLLPIPLVIGLCCAPVLVVTNFLPQNLVDGTVVAVLNHCRHRVGCDGPASGIPDLIRGISDVGTYIEMNNE